MDITAVVFDAGGVLVGNVPEEMLIELSGRYEGEEAEAIRWAHRTKEGKGGVCYGLWSKLKKDPRFTDTDYWNGFKSICTSTTPLFSFEKLILKLKKKVPFVKESVEELKEMLADSAECHLEVLEIATKAKSSGRAVGILSNHATAWFEVFVQKFNFEAVFPRELMVVSQDVECAKPEQRIYEILLERLAKLDGELTPSQVVFIDDKGENCEAAKGCGLKAINFNAEQEPAANLLNALSKLGVSL
ncbi:hypothetical protein QOT17_009258 [Balamuthia mandrillaris]